MPSFEHQFRVALFREHPELAPLLLAVPLHVPLPPYEKVELIDTTFPQHLPSEYHVDAFVLLEDADDRPQMGILVEVQLRADEEKKRSWPYYVVSAFKDRGCPVALLVLTSDEATAQWAAQPIPVGPGGSQIVPLVLGPRDVPRVEDRGEALQAPALAVLSAITHAPNPTSAPVVLAALGALESGAFGEESRRFFFDFIHSRMEAAALKALEQLMQIKGYEYQSDFARRYVAEGKAEGRTEGKAEGLAEAIILMLEKRQLTASQEQIEHILACRDEGQLRTWFERALTASTISDVLEP